MENYVDIFDRTVYMSSEDQIITYVVSATGNDNMVIDENEIFRIKRIKLLEGDEYPGQYKVFWSCKDTECPGRCQSIRPNRIRNGSVEHHIHKTQGIIFVLIFT